MKCPHRLEPHQIQGLDFIHIFPVVQVRYFKILHFGVSALVFIYEIVIQCHLTTSWANMLLSLHSLVVIYFVQSCIHAITTNLKQWITDDGNPLLSLCS